MKNEIKLSAKRLEELGWVKNFEKGDFFRKGNLIVVFDTDGIWKPGYYFSEPSIRGDIYIETEDDLNRLLVVKDGKWNYE